LTESSIFNQCGKQSINAITFDLSHSTSNLIACLSSSYNIGSMKYCCLISSSTSIFCFSLMFWLSIRFIIELRDPAANENASAPHMHKTIQNILSKVDYGEISPNPTVVIAVIVK